MNRRLRCFLCFLCFLWGLPVSVGQAQGTNNPRAFQLQQYRPWGDPQGILQTQSGRALGQWNYHVGLQFNYAKDPLLLRRGDGTRALEVIPHQLGADLTAGLGLLSWLDLWVQFPMTVYQVGKLPDEAGLGEPVDVSGAKLSDLKLGLKARFLREDRHFVTMGLRLHAGFPTGAADSFNGEDGVSFGAALMVSRQLSIVHLALQLGYRFQQRSELRNFLLDHQLTYSLGASFEVVKDKLQLLLDASGNTAISKPTLESAPLELFFAGRYFPLVRRDLALTLGGSVGLTPGIGTPQFRVLFGVAWSPLLQDADKDGVLDRDDRCPKTPGPKENRGCPWGDADSDGLTDNIDKCPKTPGPKENRGCPWGDADKDGLTDNIDKCPKVPGPKENKGCPWGDADKDGLTDNIDKCPKIPGPKENHGCPDTDRDKDGVVDRLDRCPDVFGSKEKQGCPKVILVRVTAKQIQILQKIYFATARSTIRKRSFPVLRQVVQVLKSRAKIQVRIEGHTDNRGGVPYNLRLSRRRAASVRAFLIKAGIHADRLISQGHGMGKPIAKNTTRTGRAKNRRVEFHILPTKS